MIGFLAKRLRGKNTACEYLVKNGYTKGVFSIKESFVYNDEQLFMHKKDEVYDYWGVSPMEVCKCVDINVGRGKFQNIVPGTRGNFSIKQADKWYKDTMDNHKGLVVWSDVRFQSDVDYILSMGGKVYLIERPELNKIKTESYYHDYELSMDYITNYTGVLTNSGTLREFYDRIDDYIAVP